MGFEAAGHYVRNPLATAITSAGHVIFTMPSQAAHHCTDMDANITSALWEALATPLSGLEVIERGGQKVIPLIEALIERTFVLEPPRKVNEATSSPSPDGKDNRPCSRLILGITGAVQSVLVPQQIRNLSQYFAKQIDVVLTASAQEFLRPTGIAALGVGVWCDPFQIETGRPPHIHLAASADLVLVLPATADAIFRLAHGACSDLLSLVVSATRAPVVLVPSMNPVMWQHPATQRNVQLLRGDGVFIVEPGPGTSIGPEAPDQIGGVGLGPNYVNLLGTLRTILLLSK
jgi:phosphopantothenoylcysteine decarboxylase / phosphopantothenate---cysteine ligase